MTPGDPTSKRSGNPGRAVRPAPPVRPARDIRPSSSDERVQVCGYHILQIIGKGSTGTVYRAIQLSMQREVALKVLSPELARQPGFSERFVREARAAGAVHHPNVVTCYDVGNVDGVVYQALELMSGGDLQQFLDRRGGVLPMKDAVGIVIECARGLEGIHRAGLAHCDIKPSNIFITQEETIKIADLGLARSMGNDESHVPVAVSGSLTTLAPEQLVGDPAPDIRVDTYALGVTLFIATTGRLPFDALSRDELERQILEAPVPDPRDFDPTLPIGLAAVITKSMAKDRQARYATPVQLREDLERLQFDFAPIHAALPETRRFTRIGTGHIPGTKTVHGHIDKLNEPTPHERHRAIDEPAEPAHANGPRYRLPAALAAAAAVALSLLAIWIWNRWPANQVQEPLPALALEAQHPVTTAASPHPVAELSWSKPVWAATCGEDAFGRWADLKVGNGVQRMRFCPSGTFLMGSAPLDPGYHEDEKLVRVTLRHGFWIGDTAITQRLFEAISGANPSYFTGADRPVESVDWDQAQRCIQRLNALLPMPEMRLPTEAEWEYAARAGSASTASVSTVSDGMGRHQTHPVAMMPPNAWGMYDALGNVLEWCQDMYMPYPMDTAVDPVGWQGINRVARGAAWTMAEADRRIATRSKYLPVTRFFFLGFRLAASEP